MAERGGTGRTAEALFFGRFRNAAQVKVHRPLVATEAHNTTRQVIEGYPKEEKILILYFYSGHTIIWMNVQKTRVYTKTEEIMTTRINCPSMSISGPTGINRRGKNKNKFCSHPL